MTFGTYVGVFTSEDAFMNAARAASAAGVEPVDAATPYAVHGLDELLCIAPSRLPYVTLAGGAAGLIGGFALQFFASATDWPINVGGRPWNSWPAFMPVAFETTILCAGLATAFALIARSRLGRTRDPARMVPRATDDRFALFVRRGGGAASSDPIEFLRRAGAESVAEARA